MVRGRHLGAPIWRSCDAWRRWEIGSAFAVLGKRLVVGIEDVTIKNRARGETFCQVCREGAFK